MLKSKVTKKVKKELKEILNNAGYWSDETLKFMQQFDYVARKKLHDLSNVYNNHREMSELNNL
jgi:hypothetical protein